MKKFVSGSLVLIALGIFSVANAASYTLSPLTSFGTHSDGSIQPNDPNPSNLGAAALFDINFNQRGMAVDPLTTNVVIVDTHSGSGGSSFIQGGIYVLDGTTGANLFDNTLFQNVVLSTNGMNGGNYADSAAIVADDGAVYVCNQVTGSTNLVLTIY